MDYSPLTDEDIKEMLKKIGVNSLDDLFSDIPPNLYNPELTLEEGKSELAIKTKIERLSKENHIFSSYFIGAGYYNHYIPPVVNEIVSRNEFYTAYTPYQAEVSQGMLQVIFEYQTSICNLTGMAATNASVYDGATAAVESILMAKNITRKKNILILQPLNPEYVETIESYSKTSEFSLIYSDIENYGEKLKDPNLAAVVVQNPNYFGVISDLKAIIDNVKKNNPKTLVIQIITEAISTGLLKQPAKLGVDIVCGEGQSWGMPLNFGGPGLGFIATTKKYLRKLPGRIVGKTKELFGDKEGYVLTLQAREQHIRREKALSNICSNEALCMLTAQVFLASLGYSGLRRLAELNVKKMAYFKEILLKNSGVKSDKNDNKTVRIHSASDPVFNEILVTIRPGAYQVIRDKCYALDYCPPKLISRREIDLLSKDSPSIENILTPDKEHILVCITELNEAKDIDKLAEIIVNS